MTYKKCVASCEIRCKINDKVLTGISASVDERILNPLRLICEMMDPATQLRLLTEEVSDTEYEKSRFYIEMDVSLTFPTNRICCSIFNNNKMTPCLAPSSIWLAKFTISDNQHF